MATTQHINENYIKVEGKVKNVWLMSIGILTMAWPDVSDSRHGAVALNDLAKNWAYTAIVSELHGIGAWLKCIQNSTNDFHCNFKFVFVPSAKAARLVFLRSRFNASRSRSEINMNIYEITLTRIPFNIKHRACNITNYPGNQTTLHRQTLL